MSEIMIAFTIWIQNMKGHEISYNIHEFWCKSNKYWRSYKSFSENTEKHWKTLKNTETLKHWKTLKNTEKHCKTLKKYYFLIFVWNFQKSYFHAKIINSRQKNIFPPKMFFPAKTYFPSFFQKTYSRMCAKCVKNNTEI